MKRKLLYLLISVKIFIRCIVRGFDLARRNYHLLNSTIRLGDVANYTIEIKLETREPLGKQYSTYRIKKLKDVLLYERLDGSKLKL